MDRMIRIQDCLRCPYIDIKVYNHKEGSDREFYCTHSGDLVAADGHSTYKGCEYSTEWDGEVPETCPLEKIESKSEKKETEYMVCKNCGSDGGALRLIVPDNGGDLAGLCLVCCQEKLGESLIDTRSDLTRYLDSLV